MILFLAV